MTARRALLSLVARFARVWPGRLALGILLVAATLTMGAGLLAASGTLIAGSALAGLGLLVFNGFTPGALVRGLAIGRTVTRYAERLSTHDATLRFLADLRVATFRRMVATPSLGDRPSLLFTRLTGDLDALDGVVIRFAVPFTAALLVLSGTALVLSLVSPMLAVGVAGPLALCGLVVPLVLGARGRRIVRRKHYALDAARLRLIDVDRDRPALLAGGRMSPAIATVAAAFDRGAATERALARLDLAIRIASGIGHQGAILAAAAIGAALHGDGLLSAPGYAGLVLFTLALGDVVAPFRSLATEEGRWSLAARRLDRLGGDGPGPAPDAGAPDDALVSIETAALRTEGAVGARLEDLSLAIRPGTRVALVGPSGGGKSSVIALLSRQLAPVEGRVRHRAGLRIAWLGQRTDLFAGTIAENLRLARPDATAAEMADAVDRFALAAVLAPEGIDRRLGDGGSGLSGGERRRLALARTMLRPADLVLLDEPTEGLDGETAGAVFQEILRGTEGATLVYATHRPAEAAAADVIVTIEGGRLVGIADRQARETCSR